MTRGDLKAYLHELGWSQAELARRIKVYPATVSQWKEVPGAVEAYVRLALEVRKICLSLRT